MIPRSPSSVSFWRALVGPGAAGLLLLSTLVGLLYLTGPLFMMQVYDRVLPSGSLPTLIGLCIILVILFLAFGVFETLRTQIATLRAEEFAEAHDREAFAASIDAAALGLADARAQGPEDVETVRAFLASPGFIALFDLPAIPIYFTAVTLLHPVLGLVVIASGLLLAGLAFLNERLSRTASQKAQGGMAAAVRALFGARREGESLKANGMIANAARHWQSLQSGARREQLSGAEITNLFTSITKTLRLAIQSGVLAVGAYLAVKGQLSPGAMIAASIVFARALAPVEQVLGSWRQFQRARESLDRIQTWQNTAKAPPFELPHPRHTLSAVQLGVRAPGSGRELLREVSFALKAGDVMVIAGPSGAGKTTLARALVGALPLSAGTLKFDDADISQWSPEAMQRLCGYLGQSTDFMEGTVAAIISRFTEGADEAGILAAARAAGVHEFVLALPMGYATLIGPSGILLSGGQRQRLGLARALYGDPFLVVLDEPAAHLDQPGEIALLAAIADRRARGRITVLTTHDQRLVQAATHIVAIEQGRMRIAGPREAVLQRLQADRAGKEPS